MVTNGAETPLAACSQLLPQDSVNHARRRWNSGKGRLTSMRSLELAVVDESAPVSKIREVAVPQQHGCAQHSRSGIGNVLARNLYHRRPTSGISTLRSALRLSSKQWIPSRCLVCQIQLGGVSSLGSGTRQNDDDLVRCCNQD